MTDETPSGAGTADRQEELLRQIANLAASVEQLAQRTSTRDVGPRDVGPQAEREPPTPEQEKAQFAYTFLGELLGRRDPTLKVTQVSVEQREEQQHLFMIFHDLLDGKGTAAVLRAKSGAHEFLRDLTEGEDGKRQLINITIGDDIDAVVVLNAKLVPLAIGCFEAAL
jgi:hypothetical protein